MQQPLPDDEYLLHIAVVNRKTREPRAHCAILVPAKDFDLTPAGFATKYLHNAAANLLQEFHDRNATG